MEEFGVDNTFYGKPLKLTAERVGATICGAGQGSPGWVAHGKLHAGRSLAAIRWAETSCFPYAAFQRIDGRFFARAHSPR